MKALRYSWIGKQKNDNQIDFRAKLKRLKFGLTPISAFLFLLRTIKQLHNGDIIALIE